MASRRNRSLGVLALAAPLCLVPTLFAQESTFHRAYYLHNEEGRLEEALELYRQVAADPNAKEDVRERARHLARAVVEDLAAADLARLVPEDVILYAASSRPGEEIATLLDQLGLLASAREAGPGALGISPSLLEGFFGLRGAALAVTSIDMGGGPPQGVLIVHPGQLEAMRGLIETSVSMGGRPTDPIDGFPTWELEGGVFLTRTERLLIASGHVEEIEDVLARLEGDDGDSLAASGQLRETFAVNDGLFSFCVRAEPILPMIEGILQQQAGQDPEVALALELADVGSLRSVGGYVDVDEDGLTMELALQLAEGHRSLAFDLLRMPAVERETLALVPSGAAFFAAAAINPKGAVPEGFHDAHGRPVVSAMDFGREIFGNLVDVAVYGMPGEEGANGMPGLAAVVRTNDVERSRALGNLLLTIAGQGAPVETLEIGGDRVERRRIDGAPLYFASPAGRLVFASTESAMRGALHASGGASVLDDPFFAEGLARMGKTSPLVVMANAGRCMRLAAAQEGGADAEELEAIAGLCDGTSVFFQLEQSGERLGFETRLGGLPDVSSLVSQALRDRERYSQVHDVDVHRDDAQSQLERAVAAGDEQEAWRQLDRLREGLDHDPRGLNNLAWALLTEDVYGSRYDQAALEIAERSNELSDHAEWVYLDTLALAVFRTGDVERAIQIAERAHDIADESGKRLVAPALERFRAARGSLAGPN